ncbi:MAG: ZIP family metal transporter [Nitrososphaerota archaeon]
MSLAQAFQSISGGDLMILAALAGLFTSAMNLVGALPILFLKTSFRRVSDLGLGFASGVMIAASFTSLLLPAIELGGILPALLGVVLGAVTISLMDRLIPHMHAIMGIEGGSSKLKAVWLLVLAITIHNMPEGLAVGVGIGSGDIAAGLALAIAIGIQNMPEGLSVGLSLISAEKYGRVRAYLISTASGFVELPMAVIGAIAVTIIHQIVPYAMSFAAGAMLFVVSDEIIPELHRLGKERTITYSIIAGLLTMLWLDVLFSS